MNNEEIIDFGFKLMKIKSIEELHLFAENMIRGCLLTPIKRVKPIAPVIAPAPKLKYNKKRYQRKRYDYPTIICDIVSHHNGQLTQALIAQRLDIAQSTLMPHVNKLIEDKKITKKHIMGTRGKVFFIAQKKKKKGPRNVIYSNENEPHYENPNFRIARGDC